jgi:hypothetical protein
LAQSPLEGTDNDMTPDQPIGLFHDEENGQAKARSWTIAIALTVGLFVVWAVLTADDNEPTAPAATNSSVACTHFRNVLGDADVLSDAELREKLKEVEGNASIASPAVQAAARQLLAAVTSGTSGDVQAAATQMVTACAVSG